MADRCTAVIGALADPLVPVTLRFKPGTTESGAREAARLFFQEPLRGCSAPPARRARNSAHWCPPPRERSGPGVDFRRLVRHI
jgi:hypothetical protein